MFDLQAQIKAYRARFGSDPTVAVRAPGRVNLIGEHVDYNEGLVLPMAIERAIHALAGPGEEGRIAIYSATVDEALDIELASVPRPAGPGGWEVYPKGVAAELLDNGVRLTGTSIHLDGDLPAGVGLASSAALEVAVALALLAVAGIDLTPRELARLCRRAEHNFAGVPCGIMDQFACIMSRAGSALLIDCRSEQVRHIPWPDDNVIAVVVDSRSRHRLPDSAYAQRVDECNRAADILRRQDPGIRALRDVRGAQLNEAAAMLDDVTRRRARHVVSEIERTRQAAEALQRGNFEQLGGYLNDSHLSLCGDYEVSLPQLDDLSQVIREVPGVFGCRLTGAGFGGCVVALAPLAALDAIRQAVRGHYDTRYEVCAGLMPTRPAGGVRVRELRS